VNVGARVLQDTYPDTLGGAERAVTVAIEEVPPPASGDQGWSKLSQVRAHPHQSLVSVVTQLFVA